MALQNHSVVILSAVPKASKAPQKTLLGPLIREQKKHLNNETPKGIFWSQLGWGCASPCFFWCVFKHATKDCATALLNPELQTKEIHCDAHPQVHFLGLSVFSGFWKRRRQAQGPGWTFCKHTAFSQYVFTGRRQAQSWGKYLYGTVVLCVFSQWDARGIITCMGQWLGVCFPSGILSVTFGEYIIIRHSQPQQYDPGGLSRTIMR